MIPTIDPQVKHVGISHLRKLNADTLRALEGALVICENSEPLAVIVSYETFLRMQQAMSQSLAVVGGITDNGRRQMLETRAGREALLKGDRRRQGGRK